MVAVVVISLPTANSVHLQPDMSSMTGGAKWTLFPRVFASEGRPYVFRRLSCVSRLQLGKHASSEVHWKKKVVSIRNETPT